MKKMTLMAIMATAMLSLTACGDNNQESTQTEKPVWDGKITFSDKSTTGKENPSVLIISSSPRKDGNTQQLAAEFARGAQEAGGKVETVLLSGKAINPLTEAEADDPNSPSQQDDAPEIIKKMQQADIIVLASPVYYMNIDGQMKTLIDRTFTGGFYQQLGGKEFYYITACADREDATAMCAVNAFRGFIMCLPNSVERGMVKGIGLGGMRSAKKTQFAQEAYELGKTI